MLIYSEWLFEVKIYLVGHTPSQTSNYFVNSRFQFYCFQPLLKRVKDNTNKTPNVGSRKMLPNQQLSTTVQNDSTNSVDLSFIIDDILRRRIGPSGSMNSEEKQCQKVLNPLVSYNFYSEISC